MHLLDNDPGSAQRRRCEGGHQRDERAATSKCLVCSYAEHRAVDDGIDALGHDVPHLTGQIGVPVEDRPVLTLLPDFCHNSSSFFV